MPPTTPTCHFDTLGASSRVQLRQHWPPTSHYDSLGGFPSASSPNNGTNTPNESLRLVGGFPSVFIPQNGTNDPNVSFRHVGGFLWRSTQATTTPNESLRLVGGFPSVFTPRIRHQRLNMSFRHVGGFLAFDSGNNDPQRVVMTRWGLSFCLHPPENGTSDPNVSKWLVGGFLRSSSPTRSPHHHPTTTTTSTTMMDRGRWWQGQGLETRRLSSPRWVFFFAFYPCLITNYCIIESI